MSLRYERGFSMIELMVGVGLAGIVMVLSASTLVSTSNQNALMARTASTDADQMRLTTLLSSYFAEAIDLRAAGNVDLNTYAPTVNGQGMIRDFDSDAYFGVAPRTHTLAVFWRDAAHSTTGTPAALASDVKATAIYFQKPTQTQYGRIFVTTTNSGVIQPALSDLTFTDVTRVRIYDVEVYQSDPANPVLKAPVVAFNLEISARHFIGAGEKAVEKTFCPDSVQAAGTCTNSAHKDLVTNLRVVVRNNVLGASVMGPRGSRLYDQVHFFSPNIPGGI